MLHLIVWRLSYLVRHTYLHILEVESQLTDPAIIESCYSKILKFGQQKFI